MPHKHGPEIAAWPEIIEPRLQAITIDQLTNIIAIQVDDPSRRPGKGVNKFPEAGHERNQFVPIRASLRCGSCRECGPRGRR